MNNAQKVKLIEAMMIAGLSMAARTFKPNKEQYARLGTLLDSLDAEALADITENFEDVLSVVEEFVNAKVKGCGDEK